jgi:hypothetical protein
MRNGQKTTERQLDKLVHRINAALGRARQALSFYKEAGDDLRQAQQLLPHGSWEPWLAENFDRVSPQQARAYMRLSEHWDRIAPHHQENPDLTLTDALRLLRPAKPPKDDPVVTSLESVYPGVGPADDQQPLTDCLVFRGGEVITCCSDVCCRQASPFGTEIEGGVRAELLLALLRRRAGEECQVSQGEGHLRIEGATGWSARLPLEAETERRRLEDGAVDRPGAWKPVPEHFLEAVEFVASCAANPAAKSRLVYLHLHPERLQACDNVQMCRWPIKPPLTEAPYYLIKGLYARPLAGLPVTEMAESHGWLHFRSPAGLVYSCRCYSGSYPDDDFATALAEGGVPVSLPEDLHEDIRCAAIFSRAMDVNRVRVTLAPGQAVVSAASELGNYQSAPHAFEYDGPELVFEIPPVMLKAVLEHDDRCLVGKGKLRVDTAKFQWLTLLKEPKAKGA